MFILGWRCEDYTATMAVRDNNDPYSRYPMSFGDAVAALFRSKPKKLKSQDEISCESETKPNLDVCSTEARTEPKVPSEASTVL